MKGLIQGVGFGPDKAIRVDKDMEDVLLTILSSDSSGGFIRLSKAGVRTLLSSLGLAVGKEK